MYRRHVFVLGPLAVFLVFILFFSAQTSAVGPDFVLLEDSPIGASDSLSQHVSTADIDNDGDGDVFFANSGKSILYRHDENVLVPISGGDIANHSAMSQAGVWGDYDRDGFVDLFVPTLGGV